jgi:hypothetical protein
MGRRELLADAVLGRLNAALGDSHRSAFDMDLGDQRFLMYAFTTGEAGSLIWVRSWLTDWRSRAGEAR